MRRGHSKREITKILLDVSRAVSSSLDLNEVNNLVLKESMQALRVDHAALFLFDEGSGQLMLTKAEGFSRDQVDNIKLLGSWEIINDQIAKNKKPLLVNDIKRNPIFKKAHLPFSDEEFPIQSFLAVPLIKESGMLGTLIASNRKRPGYLFIKEDEEFLVTLSNHIAIAIANAKLFEELSRIQAEAAQQEKMAVIGTLSAGINHEIKNPLSIIRGVCELFALKATNSAPSAAGELINEAKAIMEQVISQADRASVIATRLANFAKPATGQTERVTIYKEIDEVLGLVGYELRFAEINVQKRIENDLPDILVNRRQFQEVLFNLIRNAAQAINKKGTISIAARTSDGRIVIDIQDTGSGIPEDKVDKLFGAFFTTKGPGEGTGLGLYIVRKIVEKNGGAIYLKETQVDKGTTFTLEFRVAA
jgi:signal transduction histidine kinase